MQRGRGASRGWHGTQGAGMWGGAQGGGMWGGAGSSRPFFADGPKNKFTPYKKVDGGFTIALPSSVNFSSFRNSLEEYTSKKGLSLPSFEVTLTYERTGETKVFKGRSKAQRRNDMSDLLKCQKLEAGEDFPEGLKEPDRQRIRDLVCKRKEDGPMMYMGQVTFGDTTVDASAKQDTERKAEQCAAFEALKQLKFLDKENQFDDEQCCIAGQPGADASKAGSFKAITTSDTHPEIDLPGSAGFSSFKNSLQQYSKRVRVSREVYPKSNPDPKYHIASYNMLSGEKRTYLSQGKQVEQDFNNEYFCKVEISGGVEISGSSVASSTENDAEQRAAFEALKHLGYIDPTVSFNEFTGKYEGYPMGGDFGRCPPMNFNGWQGYGEGHQEWNIPTAPYHPSQDSWKEGDWICPRCGFSNFKSKLSCKECKNKKPREEQFTGMNRGGLRARGGGGRMRGGAMRGRGSVPPMMHRGSPAQVRWGGSAPIHPTAKIDSSKPVIQLPGSLLFASFKKSLQEYCVNRSIPLPEYKIKKTNRSSKLTTEYKRDDVTAVEPLLKENDHDYIAEVTFEQTAVTTGVAMESGILACERAAFTALKFLRYIPASETFEHHSPDHQRVSEADLSGNASDIGPTGPLKPWTQPPVSAKQPYINLPGTVGFSSYKNSLQEYAQRMGPPGKNKPDPTYHIIEVSKQSGERKAYVSLGKKRKRVGFVEREAGSELTDEKRFVECVQDAVEYFAKVEFCGGSMIDGGTTGSDTEKGAEQRAAFAALKHLKYIHPDASFVYMNKPPTAEELATPGPPGPSKVPIICGGTIPSFGTMPSVSLPGQPFFSSFRDSLIEFCAKIQYEPPRFELKPYMNGLLGSVQFTIGFVSTDVIEYNEADATEHVAFMALKFLRYIPIEKRFISHKVPGSTPMKRMRMDGTLGMFAPDYCFTPF